ncbi:acyltransferase family protein [Cerasicoccus arenae]|uniref:Acyltransferase n=1 Tax=Cerasicoccus arenae TaxID=424488 RepID=A0A8J3DFQ8_9BACT|nr:acyltransferase [Cerasicoccus arenae]MBK1858876.1 acyltransferase [Cerasicoccus arenae]GHB96204.1 acyltransferase [Cerasicoccus arenae]
MKRLSQLDGLRAYAVGAVVWFHWAPEAINGTFCGTSVGAIGVEVFFVLSGFLITGILLDARFKSDETANRGVVMRQFYIRRFLRIFPLYYAVLLLMILLDVQPFREAWLWHATYFQNVYQELTTRSIWGSHLWSLAVEEQFYLFWPLLMLFTPKRHLLAVMLSCIALAPLSKIIVWSSSLGIDPALLTIGTLDCFGIGAVLAILARQMMPEQMTKLCKWFFFVGVALFILAQTNLIGFMAFRQTGVALVSGALIWRASIGFTGLPGFLLQNRLAVYIGTISYGIYVIHGMSMPIWLWFYYSAPIPGYRIFERLGIPDDFSKNYWLLLAVKFSLTALLSVLSWHFFEKPINSLKRRFPYIPKSGK